jgi:hypothetical protein
VDDKKEVLTGLTAKPIMTKFLSDGMLYVWEDTTDGVLSKASFKILLCNRLWNIQRSFATINAVLNETIPVGDLPSAVKFGMAQGTICKLLENNGDCRLYRPLY